ncbi:hypothetical protein [Brucella intermedia]|uniref:hypothetical protein n=1 Tax=Brucella intermedia TaxID=94625 RepID=UPI00224A97C4|nr:hypothetical protein [Brucella intermedia]
MLTFKHISWAKLHDWFVKDNGDGSVMVEDRFTVGGGPLQVQYIKFNDFSSLLNWAGY